MAYQKRYEDSYLDKEDEEIPGDERTDGEKIVDLLRKPERSERDSERAELLTDRLFKAARMPGTPGALAVVDIALVSETQAALGNTEAAVEMWSHLSEIAEANGDKDLYFRCMDEITNVR